MRKVAMVLTGLVALQHILFMVLEMFLWTSDFGRSVFGTSPGFAAESAVLAANQGLYNGFLAAGLAWSLLGQRRDVGLFFLGCVVVAGLFGGFTAKPSIFLVQALPAACGFIALWFSRPQP